MFAKLLAIAILGFALAAPEREKRQANCQDAFRLTTNPCASGQGRVYYTFPGDDTKFVQCDVLGRAYVVQCPEGLTFNQATSACHQEVQVTAAPAGSALCTSQAIAIGQVYFPYTGDSTKFWECIAVGQAQELTCPSHLAYDATRSACVYVNGSIQLGVTAAPQQIANPCTVQQLAAGHHYFAHPDPTRFIQCDDSGEAFEVSCPSRLVWNQYSETCVSAYSVTVG